MPLCGGGKRRTPLSHDNSIRNGARIRIPLQSTDIRHMWVLRHRLHAGRWHTRSRSKQVRNDTRKVLRRTNTRSSTAYCTQLLSTLHVIHSTPNGYGIPPHPITTEHTPSYRIISVPRQNLNGSLCIAFAPSNGIRYGAGEVAMNPTTGVRRVGLLYTVYGT